MGELAPALSVATLDGVDWELAKARPTAFTLIIFYRGAHCPICKLTLQEMHEQLDELADLGVSVIAISVDPKKRAERARVEWGLDRLTIGYGLTIETARTWDLYISTGLNEDQLALFSEPGLFLIRPDGTLYYAAITSAPWGRPTAHWVVGGIKRSIDLDVPVRGAA